MNHKEAVERNEQAFRRMKATLDARFPAGHLIAFDGGEVIADAASVQELRPLLIGAGKNPSEVFVVQAGAEYPQFATIAAIWVDREPTQTSVGSMAVFSASGFPRPALMP